MKLEILNNLINNVTRNYRPAYTVYINGDYTIVFNVCKKQFYDNDISNSSVFADVTDCRNVRLYSEQ